MTSLAGQLTILALEAAGTKRRFMDPATLREHVERGRRRGGAAPPAWLKHTHRVEHVDVAGHPCWQIDPRRGTPRRELLYLHGGAYVNDAILAHWLLVARLVRALDCRVTFPIYPLAPEHRHQQGLDMVLAAYRGLLGRADPADVAVMGDSAGGGLSLALAQLLRDRRLPQPKDIVLLSPWLDITMADPEAHEIEPRDPILAIPGLIEAGRWWAGATDPADPLLSPVNANLRGLGRISLFIGTRDILLPAARKLRRRAKEQGVPLRYVEYDGMFHVFLAAPVPESAGALRQIKDIVDRPADGP